MHASSVVISADILQREQRMLQVIEDAEEQDDIEVP